MPDLAIDAEGLHRRYGRRWALIDVSLRVPAGSVVMIAGRNGSGKSTLLRVLTTAIRPDLGHATVAGFDLVSQRQDVRNATALLSHYSYLYEALTARENLEIIRGGDVMPILQRVALGDRADDPVSSFSAGMRKRLSFARVLMQDPKVVFLDEPYGQLDPEGFVLIDEVVRDWKSRGVTVVMATHQTEHVGRLADKSLTLEAGRVMRT
jgi:heme exporter protein A